MYCLQNLSGNTTVSFGEFRRIRGSMVSSEGCPWGRSFDSAKRARKLLQIPRHPSRASRSWRLLSPLRDSNSRSARWLYRAAKFRGSEDEEVDGAPDNGYRATFQSLLA